MREALSPIKTSHGFDTVTMRLDTPGSCGTSSLCSTCANESFTSHGETELVIHTH